MKNYEVFVKNYICDLIDRQIVNLKKDAIHESEMICYSNGYIEGVHDTLVNFMNEFSTFDIYDLKNFVLNYLHDKLKE